MDDIDKAALLGHNVRQASRDDLRYFLMSLASWNTDLQYHAPVIAADAYEAMELKKAMEVTRAAQTSWWRPITLYRVASIRPKYQWLFYLLVVIALVLPIFLVSGVPGLGFVGGVLPTLKDMVPFRWNFRSTQSLSVLFGFGGHPRVLVLGFDA
ncbi:hypothetical protein F4779DRAFT_604609 [Xylariaceae sp. FL0662B]|nr:hypothetical protein F4779DRAFT_604609 [Xylariaceae sp. FL0662B]